MDLHWALLLLVLSFAVATAASAEGPPRPASLPDAAALLKMSQKLSPVDLTADLSKLPANEQAALAKLVEAARLMDALFLRQSWAGNEALLLALSKDTSPLGEARLRAFQTNGGPWNRLTEEAAFVPGAPAARPPQGNFYPAGATREEVEKFLKALPDAERKVAAGFFTTLRRGPDGKIRVVPYSVEYQGELEVAAALLREAAALTTQPTLKDFLSKRAAAFLSNDYYDSDAAWMKLESSIEPTIGPYEVYEDGWFNAKAAFEAFITVRDDEETLKLAKFGAELQGLENQLPIPDALKNPKLGSSAPIRVVNSIFCAGDANKGVQTAAYNLPNDEKIHRELGAKRTMLKNVQEAKFQRVLTPIAQVALAKADRQKVAFDVFFTHILMHELMHGLGPHDLTLDGKPTTVRAQLQDAYSAIEEAKADSAGLWAMQVLIDKGVLDKAMEKTMYTTFLASAFRSLRFGLHEAHGKGIALQLNSLLDAGAVKVAPDGTFAVDPAKVKDAVRSLVTELLTLEASGDRAKAAQLLKDRAQLRPEVQKMIARLDGLPVDIAPRFATAEQLLAGLPAKK